MTTKIDSSLLELIIECIHCGEIHLTLRDNLEAYLNFVSTHSNRPKTCPICGEEAKVKR